MKKGKKTKRVIKRAPKVKRENIFNVPNLLTTLRVVITVIIIYLIFTNANVYLVVVLFLIGMFTDTADGNVARIYHQKTEFGRKFDMIADRFLLLGVVLAVLIHYSSNGMIGEFQLLQLCFIMSREIIGFPFAAIAFFSGNIIPKARIIAKTTTVLQTISFPLIILNFQFSVYFALLTGIVGMFSGAIYAKDSTKKS